MSQENISSEKGPEKSIQGPPFNTESFLANAKSSGDKFTQFEKQSGNDKGAVLVGQVRELNQISQRVNTMRGASDFDQEAIDALDSRRNELLAVPGIAQEQWGLQLKDSKENAKKLLGTLDDVEAAFSDIDTDITVETSGTRVTSVTSKHIEDPQVLDKVRRFIEEINEKVVKKDGESYYGGLFVEGKRITDGYTHSSKVYFKKIRSALEEASH